MAIVTELSQRVVSVSIKQLSSQMAMDLTLDEYRQLKGMAGEDGQKRVDISAFTALSAKCGPLPSPPPRL